MSSRVLMVSPGYVPMVGGGETYVDRIARENLAAGLQVHILASAARETADFWRGCAAPRPQDVSDASASVRRLPVAAMPLGRRGLLLWRAAMVQLSQLPFQLTGLLSTMSERIPSIVGLEQALEASGPTDIVHVFNLSWESAAIACAHYAQSRGIPLVLTPYMHFGRGMGSRVARNTTMQHQLWALKRAAAVLTLGESERRGLIALGIPGSRVHCVGAGIDTADLPTEDEQSAAIRSLDIEAPYVLVVGRISADKGIVRAIEAVDLLQSSNLSVSLVLAGEVSEELRQMLRRATRRLGGRLRVLGRVSEPAKWALLQRSACLLVLSEVESFGLVILEAWRCSRPVIGCRAGGIPDLIQHGENGILVELEDSRGLASAIRLIIENPGYGTALGEAGRACLPGYTWAAVAARIRAAYHRVLLEPGT